MLFITSVVVRNVRDWIREYVAVNMNSIIGIVSGCFSDGLFGVSVYFMIVIIR